MILDDPTELLWNTVSTPAILADSDTSTYREEALRQLSDSTTYHKLNGDPTDSCKKELSSLLDRAVSVGIFTPK